MVYVYDTNLGWNFDEIYDMQANEVGKGGLMVRMDALKVRYSIMLHEGIPYRQLPDEDKGGAFMAYEHEAMALRVLSML